MFADGIGLIGAIGQQMCHALRQAEGFTVPVEGKVPVALRGKMPNLLLLFPVHFSVLSRSINAYAE
jgi:hypothetical protein